MTGLLDLAHRTCPHGHGSLVLSDGMYGLPQLTRQEGSRLVEARMVNTGKVFTVKVFQCPQCGYLELVDSDKA